MDLKTDVTFGVGLEDFFIGEVGDLLAVDPSLDVDAVGHDAEVVPFAVLHRLVRNELVLGSQPAASGRFAVNVARLGAFCSAGFDLHLGAVDPAAVFVFVDVLEEGADHDSGVEAVVDLDVEFELEVVVLFVGGEEGVRASVFGGADDGVAFDLVSGLTAFDGPTGEVFSVEERGPFGVLGGIEFFDCDVAIPDFVAMVLEEEAAFGIGGKVGVLLEFGFGVHFLPLVAADGDVDDEFAIEVVLQVAAPGNDAG